MRVSKMKHIWCFLLNCERISHIHIKPWLWMVFHIKDSTVKKPSHLISIKVKKLFYWNLAWIGSLVLIVPFHGWHMTLLGPEIWCSLQWMINSCQENDYFVGFRLCIERILRWKLFRSLGRVSSRNILIPYQCASIGWLY